MIHHFLNEKKNEKGMLVSQGIYVRNAQNSKSINAFCNREIYTVFIELCVF